MSGEDPTCDCPACGCPHALLLSRAHCADRACQLFNPDRMDELEHEALLDVLSWIMTKDD